ncbi:glycosyltransferase family 4 protein [Sulfurimonas sediminis]|uniref:Glycosyltransferase family 4 protein n=1 Tax=Sulfurimonas sediminis TaxID=2590020 RepID=A0A7M1B0K4_9BACT|nr:glycosyltransferase family 4 protein [Sulfurimonas sediminis]QOP43244.1 glycosyltransferase family 4 protein [Sulfurimonas sediminis]
MFYVVLFFLSFALTYFIKNYATKKSLVAEVNERSSHSTPIPHGGGIAIAVTWFVGLSYLFLRGEIVSSLYYALMVGVILAVVSYLDDLYELSPKVRLVTQSGVAIGGLVALGGLNSLDFGLFSIENQLIANIIAFVAVLWFINLYNFLDGIDGYAGSEAIFLGVAGFLLFGGEHFLVLIVSVLGFLIWNWHKAKIFMGDVGSTLLGYTVAIFTIYYANEDPVNLWIWIILFGVFWFDATYTLAKRYFNGEKLSVAHKKHIYQRLTQAGFSHDRVVSMAMGMNVILFVLVYAVSRY